MTIERRWGLLVAGAVALGLAVRVGFVMANPHLRPLGDAGEYWGQANLLAEGKGFIEPYIYAATGQQLQTAKLPPLYIMLLSLCSLVGFKSFFAHRIWSAVLSASAVGLGALVGQDLAGRRVGLMAAVVIAICPNLWMSAGLGMSETISPSLVLLVLWAAYRMWRRPGAGRAAVLGLTIGFATLGRDELILFAPFILLPLAFGAVGRSWVQRSRLLAAGGIALAAVVGPWAGYNMSRFSHPVLVTDRLGLALAAANCNQAWSGPIAGFWSMKCAAASVAGARGDESAQYAAAMTYAVKYLSSHIGGLPKVELERMGRTFGFYRPVQQIDIDSYVEGRPKFWAFVGLGMFYSLVPLSLWGGRVLRRRGLPLFPMVAVAADVVVVVLITYGTTRFRVTLDAVLVLLAAIAVDDLIRRPRREAPRRRPALGASPAPSCPMSGVGSARTRRAASDA